MKALIVKLPKKPARRLRFRDHRVAKKAYKKAVKIFGAEHVFLAARNGDGCTKAPADFVPRTHNRSAWRLWCPYCGDERVFRLDDYQSSSSSKIYKCQICGISTADCRVRNENPLLWHQGRDARQKSTTKKRRVPMTDDAKRAAKRERARARRERKRQEQG